MTRLRSLYFIVANTAILLLVAELGAHVAITNYHRVGPALFGTRPTTHLSDVAKANYAHMAPTDVDDLLRTTQSLRFQFAPWIGPREGAVASRGEGWGFSTAGGEKPSSSNGSCGWWACRLGSTS